VKTARVIQDIKDDSMNICTKGITREETACRRVCLLVTRLKNAHMSKKTKTAQLCRTHMILATTDVLRTVFKINEDTAQISMV
jgi:hypothetical protein